MDSEQLNDWKNNIKTLFEKRLKKDKIYSLSIIICQKFNNKMFIPDVNSDILINNNINFKLEVLIFFIE